MCLSVAMNMPEMLEESAKREGYEYHIAANPFSGARCGYVKLEPGHPWRTAVLAEEAKEDGHRGYNEIDCSVHGGLTFGEPDVNCDKDGPDDGYWVGFDCNHHNDRPDPAILTEDGKVRRLFEFQQGTVRTQDYVRAEIFSLISQAKEAQVNA